MNAADGLLLNRCVSMEYDLSLRLKKTCARCDHIPTIKFEIKWVLKRTPQVDSAAVRIIIAEESVFSLTARQITLPMRGSITNDSLNTMHNVSEISYRRKCIFV